MELTGVGAAAKAERLVLVRQCMVSSPARHVRRVHQAELESGTSNVVNTLREGECCA
ncbi:hypothetical protein BDW59DRAFT_149846 [Aspergillus cavernicola]|uniref:Uncharacterized protein n=1 Tax=Aspergillus cavernicola TaxID=176166 RepID=A0ABR4I3B8_9EURO